MTRRGWAELIVLAALWGAVYPLIEIALRDLSPVLVVLGRVLLAAALLTPFAIHRRALAMLWKRPRAIVETALVQSTIPLLLLTFGQQYVPSGVAGILVGAQPLFVGVLAIRLDPDERPRGYSGLLGIVLGTIGLVLLFGGDLRGGMRAVFGGLLVLTAALCYAAGAIMIHKRHAEAQPLGVATSAMLVTTGALTIPAALSLPDQPPKLAALTALGVLGVVCTGVTLVMFYTLIVEVGPGRAALAFYLSPAFAVAFGVVFLNEQLTITVVTGLIAIIAGSILAARRIESLPT
jgi:drug/metabolite transporter (DMT)-like permease